MAVQITSKVGKRNESPCSLKPLRGVLHHTPQDLELVSLAFPCQPSLSCAYASVGRQVLPPSAGTSGVVYSTVYGPGRVGIVKVLSAFPGAMRTIFIRIPDFNTIG